MPNIYSWYNNTASQTSPDAIHQTLAYGTMNDIKKLKEALGEDKLQNIFLTYPKKVYTPSGLHFISKFILHLTTIDEQKYLKFTPRNSR